jgi:hypothetical protein
MDYYDDYDLVMGVRPIVSKFTNSERQKGSSIGGAFSSTH